MVKRVQQHNADQDELNRFNMRLAKGFANQLDDLYDQLRGMADSRKLEMPRALRIGEWSRLEYLERIQGNETWASYASLGELDYLIETRSGESELSEGEWNLLEQAGKVVNFNVDTLEYEFGSTVQTSLSDSQIAQVKEWYAATYEERAIGFGLWVYVLINTGQLEPEAAMYHFRLALDSIGFIHAEESARHAENKTRKELAREEAERLSQRIEELNKKRHRATREVRAMTVMEWDKDRSKFPSASKAGNHFAKWLADQGIDYEPSTVIGWIRAYAKQEGVRWR